MCDAVLLAGDRYHKAEDAFAGVGPALENAELRVQYTTDNVALNAQLLEGKRLLCILRDGMEWPNGYEQPNTVWMTPEQENAIEHFVQAGERILLYTMRCGHIPGKMDIVE